MIKIKATGFDDVVASLEEDFKAIARASRNAANTTATAVLKESFNEAATTYNIDDKERLKTDSKGRETTYIQRAQSANDAAIVTFKGGDGPKAGDRPGLQHFAVESEQIFKSHSARGEGYKLVNGKFERVKIGGPKYRIKRGGPVKEVERGFYGQGKLKGQGIFQRQVGSRKIVRRTGPSIKQMIEDSKVWENIEEKGQTIFMQKLKEAVDKQLAKKGKE